MRRALDSSDVELLKLIDTEEGFYLDESLPLHYAVDSCIREVVKALLELGAVDVNYPAGATGFNIRTVGGIITPLDILRTLTSDFLFKGAVPGLTHIEPNKLRLCLELVQSARMVISREEGNNSNNNNNDHNNPIHPQMNEEHNRGSNEN